MPTAPSDVCCLGKSGRIGVATLLPLVNQSGRMRLIFTPGHELVLARARNEGDEEVQVVPTQPGDEPGSIRQLKMAQQYAPARGNDL